MSSFTTLQAAFKGDLVTPEAADYEEALTRWAINARRNAQVVAFAKDAQDVSLAIGYARDSNLRIAIKGGGHSTAGNSSSTGVTIDLSRYLRKVEIDTDKMLGYVDAGCIWEDVDKAAIEKGCAAVGGTVNHTGVAGYTVGGGYGWLSGAHGLAIDNLVQVTIVVADGRILTANAEENVDLFFGIRGGGSNFGVVTQFVFKVHPQRRTIYAGPLRWPAHRLKEVIEVTRKWYSTIKPNEGIMHNFSKGPNGAPIIKTILFYNGSEVEGRENFKALLDLKPDMDGTGEIPYEKMNSMINAVADYGRCRLFKGAFWKDLDLGTIQKMFERAVALTTGEHDTFFVVEYNNLDKVLSVQAGETAFIRKDAGNMVMVTSWTNDTPENTAIARANTKEVNDIVVESQNDLLGFKNQGYGNYDQDGTEQNNIGIVKSSAENLFGENYPKLQQVKAKYDPNNVFSKWFAIKPASSA